MEGRPSQLRISKKRTHFTNIDDEEGRPSELPNIDYSTVWCNPFNGKVCCEVCEIEMTKKSALRHFKEQHFGQIFLV